MAEDLFEACRENLRQGDIFESLKFVRADQSEEEHGLLVPKAAKTSCRGMIINQSCDLDKPKAPFAVVVPVIELAVLSRDLQTNVKKNKVFYYLFLPAYREVMPDCFVSFHEPMTVAKAALRNSARVLSLSETGRRALYMQYSRWISHWSFAEICCPNCGVQFDPSTTLPVEND